MKRLFFSNLLLLAYVFCFGQIRGTVKDDNSTPIEKVRITNISIQSYSVTNADGNFEIMGNLGDSILIQHISYKLSKYKVERISDNYFISPQNYSLEEITITSNDAFELFKNSCKKTFDKMKEKSISKGYLQYLKMEGSDSLIIQSLDLDIQRKKLANFDKGETISIFKIQERTVNNSAQKTKDLKIKKYICPPINQFDWNIFSKSFNYHKIEDAEHIKLFFLSKGSISDVKVNYEVIIQKEDSCLLFFASTSESSSVKKNEQKFDSLKSYSFTRFGFLNDSGFYDETFDKVEFINSKDDGKNIEMSIHYKTYDNGLQNSKLRQKGNKIHDNIFDPHFVSNRYVDEFWINNIGLGKVNYNFEYLSDFGMK